MSQMRIKSRTQLEGKGSIKAFSNNRSLERVELTLKGVYKTQVVQKLDSERVFGVMIGTVLLMIK